MWSKNKRISLTQSSCFGAWCSPFPNLDSLKVVWCISVAVKYRLPTMLLLWPAKTFYTCFYLSPYSSYGTFVLTQLRNLKTATMFFCKYIHRALRSQHLYAFTQNLLKMSILRCSTSKIAKNAIFACLTWFKFFLLESQLLRQESVWNHHYFLYSILTVHVALLFTVGAHDGLALKSILHLLLLLMAHVSSQNNLSQLLCHIVWHFCSSR